MKKKKLKKALLFTVVTLLSLFWIAPLIATVAGSFQAGGETAETAGFTLKQYRQILIETPVYLNLFWNSVGITVCVLIGSIVVSLFGAYGFTVLSFRGKEILFFVYLVVMLLPLQVTLMPNYMVAAFFGIEKSYLAIILPAVFSPFGVFLLRQQMKLLPAECVEAAKIDGAGAGQIFVFIFLPLVKSGIAALAMLLAIEYWNLIDQAIIFIKEAERYPLSVFLARVNDSSLGVSQAAAVFYSVPILALLFYGHEYLKEGIGLMDVQGK